MDSYTLIQYKQDIVKRDELKNELDTIDTRIESFEKAMAYDKYYLEELIKILQKELDSHHKQEEAIFGKYLKSETKDILAKAVTSEDKQKIIQQASKEYCLNHGRLYCDCMMCTCSM